MLLLPSLLRMPYLMTSPGPQEISSLDHPLEDQTLLRRQEPVTTERPPCTPRRP